MESQKQSTFENVRHTLREHLPLLRENYRISSLGLFGSYVRGDQDTDSDLDVLITFSETPSLLQFIALEDHLTDLLGIQVDLVMRDALKPHLSKRILEEVVPV
ncbi:MAG: nucleotidyltransferase family protein [Anaerolineae bacterium]|nr:nucleotidyltransferase family protein [Anaerolineae bacterium]